MYAGANTSIRQLMYQAVEAAKQTFGGKPPQIIYVLLTSKVSRKCAAFKLGEQNRDENSDGVFFTPK